MKKLTVLCLTVLASACVVVADDDESDTNVSSGGSTSSASTTSSTSSTSGTTSSTTSTSDDTTTAGSTSAASDSASSSGGGSACGWGVTDEPDVPMGYVCGGDGEDPDGAFAMACPESLTLEEGGGCGDLTGVGCCDAEGNVWFCADDGVNGPQLFTETCG